VTKKWKKIAKIIKEIQRKKRLETQARRVGSSLIIAEKAVR
jgi:hypothetical protein